ncbi:unnamed protein product [Protopolystoma xenopodis]|uniref:Uncharacterized protein n=1 Tax=Protopolystoma xenopodis TaxID=117903 RepID=A0A3S5A6M0_9PLAT|nr:unnamed protein product [Protopolystoma xenopodis]
MVTVCTVLSLPTSSSTSSLARLVATAVVGFTVIIGTICILFTTSNMTRASSAVCARVTNRQMDKIKKIDYAK